jgi:hypothetical protein
MITISAQLGELKALHARLDPTSRTFDGEISRTLEIQETGVILLDEPSSPRTSRRRSPKLALVRAAGRH